MTIQQLQERFNTLRNQKKYAEGISLIERWIEDNSEDPQALYMLGELLDKRAYQKKERIQKK